MFCTDRKCQWTLMTFPTDAETLIAVLPASSHVPTANSPPIGMTKLSNMNARFFGHFLSWSPLPAPEIHAELCHTSNICAASSPLRFNPCRKSPIATSRTVRREAPVLMPKFDVIPFAMKSRAAACRAHFLARDSVGRASPSLIYWPKDRA